MPSDSHECQEATRTFNYAIFNWESKVRELNAFKELYNDSYRELNIKLADLQGVKAELSAEKAKHEAAKSALDTARWNGRPEEAISVLERAADDAERRVSAKSQVVESVTDTCNRMRSRLSESERNIAGLTQEVEGRRVIKEQEQRKKERACAD